MHSVHCENLCDLHGSRDKQRLFPCTALNDLFAGAFAKLRKATISFVISVHLRTHWTDLDEILYLSFFLSETCRENSSLIENPIRIKGTLHEDVFTFTIISHWIILRVRNISDKRCRENQNTHFIFNNFTPHPPKKMTFMR